MEYKFIKGLLKIKVGSLKGRRWYHQRFDGTPYFIHYIAESEIISHEERKKGGDFEIHASFFENDRNDWYIEYNEMKKVAGAVIRLAKDDPEENILNLWQDDEKIFWGFCLQLGKTDFSKLTDNKLIALHDKAREIGFARFSSSSLIDGFALYTDEIIADKIKAAIKGSPQYKFPQLFSVLTAPAHQSFINESEIGLMQIALQPEEMQKALLEQHAEKWFWIHNNYAFSYVLTAEDFGKEIMEMKKSNVNFAAEKEKIENTPIRNEKEKRRLIVELGIDSELKNLIKISEQFTYWQDERKKATYWLINYYSLLLEEIGRRIGLTLHEMKYLSPTEVSGVFNNCPTKEEMTSRLKRCAFYWDKEGHECITDEKEIEELKQIISASEDYSGMETFTGLCAAVGKTVGRAKICKSATEIGKVQQGDVLVAVMTRPDYVPAMKRACAIVTNEGGITSHAAIVSREIGIPCIIGTKIATEVLKDGDLVEVNANHGQVKVLEKSGVNHV